MQVTFELSPDIEARLRQSIAHGDTETARRLLADALTPTVEALLQEMPVDLPEAEFEAVADQLADELMASLEPNTPPLSDYAVSRAGIYGDHP
ncbi:MAG: hypothetical protein AB7G75_26185 [Candidatus Binatia bacterium]